MNGIFYLIFALPVIFGTHCRYGGVFTNGTVCQMEGFLTQSLDEAVKLCGKMNGTLPLANTDVQVTALLATINTTFLKPYTKYSNAKLWIPLIDGKWPDGSTYNLYKGSDQPRTYVIDRRTGEWLNGDQQTAGFICNYTPDLPNSCPQYTLFNWQLINSTQLCYIFVNCSVDWNYAYSNCIDRVRGLNSFSRIQNAKENEALYCFARLHSLTVQYAWLDYRGFYNNNCKTWQNGDPMTYFNFVNKNYTTDCTNQYKAIVMPSSSSVLILVFLIQLSSSCTFLDPSRCITFHNNCPFDIYPAILGQVGNNPPQHDGFLIPEHVPYNYRFPDNWTHIQLWARENCDSNFTCATGSCGMSLQCDGSIPSGPLTTVEIWPTTSSVLPEKYQVNVTKGFNLQVRVQPALFTFPTQYNPPVPLWPEIGCNVNMATLDTCFSELRYIFQGGIYGCQHPCLKFQTPEFCCTGQYASPTACQSTIYEQSYATLFGGSCPTANYSPFDNKIFSTGLFIKPVYNITFCA